MIEGNVTRRLVRLLHFMSGCQSMSLHILCVLRG